MKNKEAREKLTKMMEDLSEISQDRFVGQFELYEAHQQVHMAYIKIATRESEIAPNGRCNVCDKICPFEHGVSPEELVCDVCAGNDEVDW